jgi:hypothetical protein
LLNHLSNMASDEEPDGSFQPPNLNGENGNAGAVADGEVADATAQAPAAVKSDGKSNGHVPPAQDAAPTPPAPIHVERPPRAPKPSGVVVPGDPTLN